MHWTGWHAEIRARPPDSDKLVSFRDIHQLGLDHAAYGVWRGKAITHQLQPAGHLEVLAATHVVGRRLFLILRHRTAALN